MSHAINVTNEEFHTILAALRFYQQNGQGDPANRSDAIHNLATNLGQAISLDDAGIDELCEQLNTPVETKTDSDPADDFHSVPAGTETKTAIVVFVQGGVVQGVRANVPGIALEVIDFDNLCAEGKNRHELEAIERSANESHPFEVG
ncbi:MAG: hypothetical protein L0Y72_24455 [Gemmataceae bacterium]|nr:hypothetical protein [Gemmataceae bacterium]MCI0742198.1 hypothetical protein [Gemmataceae bacterium]